MLLLHDNQLDVLLQLSVKGHEGKGTDLKI